MDLKSLLIKENSPSFISKTSRSKLESCFRFPTLEKCRSIEKISEKYSKKAHEKISGKSNTLYIKQTMIEILNGIKESSEKGQKLKLAFKAFDYFTRESGVFQKELTIIEKELFESVYCEKNKLQSQIKEWIYEKYDFAAYDQDNYMPMTLVLEYWKDAYEKMKNAYNQQCHEMGLLREEIEFKQADINYLRSELDNIKDSREDSTKETLQEISVKDLQPKEKFEIHIKGLNDIIDDLYSQLSNKEEIIRDHENNLKFKENLTKSLEESKKKYHSYLKSYKSEIKALRDQNDKLRCKLESIETEVTQKPLESLHSPDLTLRPDTENCGNLFSSCIETSTQGKFRYLIHLISSLKLKKVKKTTSPGQKKKPFTDLPTPYRKQQSLIKNS